MKLLPHFRIRIIAVGLLLISTLAAQRKPAGGQSSESAANSAKTLTGVISDAVCGRKHAMPGKSDAECTRECVHRGSQHALIVGEKVYILEGSPADKLDELAGARVLVSGTVQGEIIRVEAVTVEPSGPDHPKH
jgi:hypothetical protein